MVVKKGQQVLMEAERRNSLYYLLAEAVVVESHSVGDDSLKMWHLRLGHPAEGGVKELIRKGLITGDTSSKLGPCEQCILGKSKKNPFPAGIHTSQAPLDYVHSDLWGPSPVNTIGGGRYYMSIIDDYSRKLWVFILKEKSEAFLKFKHWCKEVEVEKGRSLKCLRTDNGLEYLSKEFEDFCRERGIKRHKTVPSNPQQNGIAERMNRTILERVRCLLFTSGLSKRFWGEAVCTAAYLINKCPAVSLRSETPDFRWYGSHGDYSKFRIFGCAAYAHIRNSKLEPRALKCIMLGYQSGVKGYRLWCTEAGNQKVIISRDVVFVEHQMPYLSQKDNSDKATSDLFEVEVQNSPSDSGASSNQEGGSQQESANPDQDGESTQPSENLENYQLARDRVRRVNVKPPSRFAEADMVFYALCVAENVEYADPASYKEAMLSKEKEQWVEAMKDEIQSLLKNKTWLLVDKSQLKAGPEVRKLISCKWVFKKKLETTGQNKIKFKARLVARGFTQEEGVDFNEVFAPVVKHASIRILLAVANQRNWELQQLDVKTAFLNGDLEETIFMEQPEGFIQKGEENKICLLKKSLYGLKQSPRQWNKKFDEQMDRLGFQRSKYDDCVYVKKVKGVAVAYLLLYVDDMLLAGPSMKEVQKVKDELQSCFEMKDLGEAKKILGMDILRNRSSGELWLTQSDYIERVLKRFNMSNVKEAATPLSQSFKLSKNQAPKSKQESFEMDQIPYASVVGSIMYIMICTRPDLSHALSVTSRYMSDPGKEHWSALKWVLRYLKGSSGCGILFKRSSKVSQEAVVGYCDADFATNLDNRKSQSGYLFTLFGSVVSWKSSLQSVVALSTTEAEYMALTSAVKESFWIQGVAADFGIVQETIPVFCDSSSAICLAQHQYFHERSKHIDVRLHFIRDEVEKGRVKVVKIDTLHNPADMLTKVLGRDKLEHCKELILVCKQD